VPGRHNQDPPTEVGFVTCPVWILTHRGLADGDKVVLMMLDLLGWREGSRDGMVRATNEEIAARLGKSTSTVKRHLQQIAAIDPPLIEVDRIVANTRDSIRLCYDRYGADSPTVTRGGNGGITPTEEGVAHFCTTPGATLPIPTPIGGDGEDKEGVAQICTTPGVAHFCTTPPIYKEDVVVDVVGVAHFCTTPALDGGIDADVATVATFPTGPRTIAELVAWLPGFTGDSEVIRRLTRDLPLWLQGFLKRFPERTEAVFADWVTDALIESTDAKDPVRYARKILKGWAEAGGRSGIEVPLPAPIPAEPILAALPAVPYRNGNGYHPRPSKADRNAQAAVERDAMIDLLFPQKEAADGLR
jgi:hypothetical protein